MKLGPHCLDLTSVLFCNTRINNGLLSVQQPSQINNLVTTTKCNKVGATLFGITDEILIRILSTNNVMCKCELGIKVVDVK